MPESSPLTIEGIAPIRMTKYTVASDKPNQMIAAGTQATEGSTCRPEMRGPAARRRGRHSARSNPRGVPTMIAMRKPMTPRSRLVDTASCSRPASHALAERIGDLQGPRRDVRARGRDDDVELPGDDQHDEQNDGRESPAEHVPPARPTLHSNWTAGGRGRLRGCAARRRRSGAVVVSRGIAADLLPELGGDLGGEGGDLG